MNKHNTFFIYIALLTTLLFANTLFAKDIAIGSYNIKNFGKTKASNPFVMENLAKILSRYDIAFLQEMRNKDQLAILALKEAVEKYTGTNYSIIISKPLGRSTYKEQYAYLYNPEKVELLDYYTYEDGEEPYFDTFSREPFIAHFRAKGSKTTFSTVGVHIAPSFVVSEMDEMTNVYEDVEKKWRNNNIIAMGDFNADCTYLDDFEEEHLKLSTNDALTWHIKRGADTTTDMNTHCAYDRFVTSGKITQKVDQDRTKVYNVMEELNLSEEEAYSISDHFPIEMILSI